MTNIIKIREIEYSIPRYGKFSGGKNIKVLLQHISDISISSY
jgi:hypothetical protein